LYPLYPLWDVRANVVLGRQERLPDSQSIGIQPLAHLLNHIKTALAEVDWLTVYEADLDIFLEALPAVCLSLESSLYQFLAPFLVKLDPPAHQDERGGLASPSPG